MSTAWPATLGRSPAMWRPSAARTSSAIELDVVISASADSSDGTIPHRHRSSVKMATKRLNRQHVRSRHVYRAEVSHHTPSAEALRRRPSNRFSAANSA
jgi:hypothetical protein